ncbi:MAG: hypothetical protein Q4A71_07540 [Actinomycetaceae bacterium]|nr:hypothetical protein [Actinomycetaceae bacterium]
MSTGILLCLEGELEVEMVMALGKVREVSVERRCADLTEVEAAALAGIGQIAVIDAGTAGLTLALLDRLEENGIGSILVGNTPFADRQVVPPHAADIIAAIGATVPKGKTERKERIGVAAPTEVGKIVALIGAGGAPGKTTLACALANSIPQPSILVDADIFTPAVAISLGLEEEAPGLISAVRLADRAALDALEMEMLLQTSGDMRVLGGLNLVNNWRDVEVSAFGRVLSVCRQMVPWTVVDTYARTEYSGSTDYGFGPGHDDVLGRIIEDADTLVLVGRADPVGFRRLVVEYKFLQEQGHHVGHIAITGVGSTKSMSERHVRDVAAKYLAENIIAFPHDPKGIGDAQLRAKPWQCPQIEELVGRITGVRATRRRHRVRK